METINDVLLFLNYLDFVADLRNDKYTNFNHIKKFLKKSFQDVGYEQVIHMLGDIDDLHNLFLNQSFNEVNTLTESLREKTFTLYGKKTVEE